MAGWGAIAVGDDVASLDRALEALGYKSDGLELAKPRSSPTMPFHRDELKRFLLDELRQETAAR